MVSFKNDTASDLQWAPNIPKIDKIGRLQTTTDLG